MRQSYQFPSVFTFEQTLKLNKNQNIFNHSEWQLMLNKLKC